MITIVSVQSFHEVLFVVVAPSIGTWGVEENLRGCAALGRNRVG